MTPMKSMTPAHDYETLQQMLSKAKCFVARGAERVQEQKARAVSLKRQGLAAEQSKKLLEIMTQTQELQVSHVELLERELGDADH
jgi:hypothetical protein